MANSNKSTYWSITINNPTDEDETNIQEARQRRWKVEGQKEQGKEGTTHYQLILHTPDRPRFSSVKKQFPRAHIEAADNPIALKQYVHKEDTRIGQLQEQQEMYPSLTKFWELILNELNTGDKEGLLFTSPNELTLPLAFYRESNQRIFDKEPLELFDTVVNSLILKGYHVETIAVNPSTRSSFKKYGKSLLTRAYNNLKQKGLNNENAIQTETSYASSSESLSQTDLCETD